ncbi:ribokinase [Paraliobacillus quinghaiensis]|uniref:Ribokinase n=1 Tax=Paraliobacillus quinghaiensis TaxID=470815 RepID=A0A917TY86_9BACI|nr:ribokinase [Paraliobacillus quinghaiensis]GGM42355.1 ribokinase [Paraliobacillus quinghaiensis]
MDKPKVTVIGSINMDMVTTTSRIPVKGETLIGEGFKMVPGGKGANQAVAAARLGVDVNFIGRVGNDHFGEILIEQLIKQGVTLTGVEPVIAESSGVATILLAEHDNRIMVTPGANNHVTPEYVARYTSIIKQSDIVLLQLEIPLQTIEYVADYCKREGIPVILNPAPAQLLSDSLLRNVSFVTPNETEALAITENIKEHEDKMIVTLGEAGVRYKLDQKEVTVPGFPVAPVDTTGAGDTFNGALAVALARGEEIKQAISYANAAAALSVLHFGAQGGMPDAAAVANFLNERKKG